MFQSFAGKEPSFFQQDSHIRCNQKRHKVHRGCIAVADEVALSLDYAVEHDAHVAAWCDRQQWSICVVLGQTHPILLALFHLRRVAVRIKNSNATAPVLRTWEGRSCLRNSGSGPVAATAETYTPYCPSRS